MDKLLEPNPLNVFEVRRVKFPPDHFDYANVETMYNIEDAILRWIEINLKGKFYFGKSISLDKQNNIIYVSRIGFEKSKELSFFMLACPHLKYN